MLRAVRTDAPVAVVAALEIGWLLSRSALRGPLAWGPLVAVVVAHTLVVARERRHRAASTRAVVVCVTAVAVAAALIAPAGSKDLYQYAFYGRMVAQHGADPYVTAPGAFPHDPLFASLAPGWHGARSVYGPVFTWYSALGARLFGGSALGARLWFQFTASAALVGSAGLLLRCAGNAAALGVGLAPPLVAAANGGHNDLLVGVLVLLAVHLADRPGDPACGRRGWQVGIVLALAACVKASALPAVLALGLVGIHRRTWRPLVVGGVTWVAAVGSVYAAGGGTHLLVPLRAVGVRTSRASAWSVIERWAAGAGWGGALLAGAGVVAAALVVATALRWRRAALSNSVAAAGLVACFAAPYVLAWYPAAVLPAAALADHPRVRAAAVVGSTALLAAYVVPAGVPPGSVPLAPVAAVVCGSVLAMLVVVLVGGPAGAGYRRRGGQPGCGGARRGLVPGVPEAGRVAGAGGRGEAGRLPR